MIEKQRSTHIAQKKLSQKNQQLGRVDRASAAETKDLGSIRGRVQPKTIELGIHNFPS